MGRAPCCSKVGLHRGPWTTKEDSLLTNYIKLHGEGHWRALPKQAGLLRCGKSCRLRWMNYLRPDIKRGNITAQEDDLIIRLHSLLGNRWSLIAGRLPGRTDNEIKNYWNTRLSKKLPLQQPTSSLLLPSASQPKKITKPKKKSNSVDPDHIPASKLTPQVEIEIEMKHIVHQPKPARLGLVKIISGQVLTSESNNNNTNNVVESSSFSSENYMSVYNYNNSSEEGEQEVDDEILAVAADHNDGSDDTVAVWTDEDIYNIGGVYGSDGGMYGGGDAGINNNNNGVWERMYEEYLQLTNAGGCQEDQWQLHDESLLI